MGIRLKVLISIFAMLAIYSIYYWGVPACINLNKLSPLLTNYIENEYGYKVAYKNANFKMGLTPTIWLKADEFKILNDDKSTALIVEKPVIELDLLPLVINHVNLKYFSSDNIEASFTYDKNLHLSLGQYLLLKMTDSKVSINHSKILVNEYTFKFKNLLTNKSIIINGDYFNIDKFKIMYTKNGKPFLDNDVYLSISHDKDIVVVALSNVRVGIDIQYYRKLDIDMLNNMNKLLNVSSNTITNFSIKEAILKLNGDVFKNINNYDINDYHIISHFFS